MKPLCADSVTKRMTLLD